MDEDLEDPRGARWTRAVRYDGHRARSDRQPPPADPTHPRRQRCGSAFATGMASDRDTAEALARKYHDPSAAARTFALAFTHAESGLRHLGISADEAVLFERLASRVLGTRPVAARERRDDRRERARPGRPLAARDLGRLADPARPRRRRRRRAARAAGAAGPGVLAAERPDAPTS